MPTETEAVVEAVATEKVPYAFPFTVGADPEFTVLSGSRPLKANEMLKAFIKDGVPQSSLGFDFPEGNIGWDGHDGTGEVRPKPGTPREVGMNVGALFTHAISRMPFATFTTLNVAHPTGGHIHLSVPEEMTSMATNKTAKWRAMERAMASFVLLILIGENKLSRDSRRNGGGNYGSIMDFRVEQKFQYPNGNPGFTLEVRGPTAEWTTTKEISIGTLAFMAIAWDSVLKGSTALSPIADILFKTKMQAEESVTPFLANFMNLQRIHVAKMRRFVRSHPAYPDYKDELELILNPERVLAAKRAAHFDVSEGWHIGINSKDVKVKDFMKDKDIDEKTSKFPEAVMRNVSQFSWNDDLNVQMFATALSKRCVGLGWKPQHEYFLFGMKKGLDAIVIRNEVGEFIAGADILKTQSDITQLKKKFDRLVTKAAPAYGNVMNPRTGEIANSSDMQRVMVGIPYDMRQKGDTRELLRMILKFEKTPGAFPVIDAKSLPSGKGQVEAILEEGRVADEQYERAFKSGDRMVHFSAEALGESSESRASNALIHGTAEATGGPMSGTTLDIAEATFMDLVSDGDYDDAISGALDRAAVNEGLHDILLSDLQHLGEISAPETREALSTNPRLVCWLVLYGLGQRGRVSLNTSMRWNHTVFYENSVYQMFTSGQGESLISHRDFDVIADLMGISDPVKRLTVADALENSAGSHFMMTAVAGSSVATGHAVQRGISREFYVSPDPELPQVWG